jgi:hypothetical protein
MNTAEQVDLLIAHVLSTRSSTSPPMESSTTLTSRERLRKHLLRVLGSVIGSTNTERNEQAVVESIKKTILRGSRSSTTSDQLSASRKALKFQELVGRIRRQRNLNSRCSIYLLLRQLYNTGSSLNVRATQVAATAIHADRHHREEQQEKEEYSNEEETKAVDSMIYGTNLSTATATTTSDIKTQRKRTLIEPTRFQLEENMSSETSEQYLIRDVIYTFQGIDGTFIKYSERANGYIVVPTVGVPASVRSMVGKLCEMGW